jgi:aryl-alcohol dehydrogenase-like predicted oxidoreductase
MSIKPSRRRFLQAGLMLPAADLISSQSGGEAFQAPSGVPYRTLGKTGLKVAGVGFGLGFTPDPEIISRAIDLGVNYFDTSRVYGQGASERIFGAAIKGKRDKILIATKTGSRTKADILKDMDTSLQTLGTDHVDVYHLHARDTPERVPDEAVEALQIVKNQGKTRAVGISTHDPNHMVDHILKCKLDIVQTTYSYAIGAPFRDFAIKKLHDAGVGVIAMKVVIALSGIGLKDFEQKPKLRSEEVPISAIRWVLRNPAIGTTVPHHGTIKELEMNVQAMTGSYSPADEKLLYVRNEQIRPYYCRMCFQCRGQCPQDIPVAEELRFLAYYDFGEDLFQARLSFMDLPRKVRNLRCSECSSCAVRCPNGVMVRDRLIRAQELLA